MKRLVISGLTFSLLMATALEKTSFANLRTTTRPIEAAKPRETTIRPGTRTGTTSGKTESVGKAGTAAEAAAGASLLDQLNKAEKANTSGVITRGTEISGSSARIGAIGDTGAVNSKASIGGIAPATTPTKGAGTSSLNNLARDIEAQRAQSTANQAASARLDNLASSTSSLPMDAETRNSIQYFLGKVTNDSAKRVLQGAEMQTRLHQALQSQPFARQGDLALQLSIFGSAADVLVENGQRAYTDEQLANIIANALSFYALSGMTIVNTKVFANECLENKDKSLLRYPVARRNLLNFLSAYSLASNPTEFILAAIEALRSIDGKETNAEIIDRMNALFNSKSCGIATAPKGVPEAAKRFALAG